MNSSWISYAAACGVLVGTLLTRTAVTAAATSSAADANIAAKALVEARDKGLAWLTKNQGKDGAWGVKYPVAVTSLACLSYLAASDEPFKGDNGQALVRGLTYLMSRQEKGVFPTEGSTWIHVQGFATLALSEAYGRTLFCKTTPDMDMAKVKAAIPLAIRAIQDNQSDSGGWWYTQGSKSQHEGSTTVTAVQAMVSAANFAFQIDEQVLEKGFEYLKKCQNKDGGFDYQFDNNPDGPSMKEGTAADVATLALMRKFDFQVMLDAAKFLVKVTPAGISKERFPYYGHFYACMGMKLLGEEMRSLQKDTGGYIAGALADIRGWQKEDGSWPVKEHVKSTGENDAYATAFATLALSVGQGRLSIFNRTPPKLPKPEGSQGAR
jgi:hypothetical protein